MARPSKKDPTPSDAEREALKKLFYDSCLMGCHGIVICNVQEYLGELFTLMKRPDLAALAADLSTLTS